MSSKRVELLAPAGNFDRLKIAFLYGADAVYSVHQLFQLSAQGQSIRLAGHQTLPNDPAADDSLFHLPDGSDA